MSVHEVLNKVYNYAAHYSYALGNGAFAAEQKEDDLAPFFVSYSLHLSNVDSVRITDQATCRTGNRQLDEFLDSTGLRFSGTPVLLGTSKRGLFGRKYSYRISATGLREVPNLSYINARLSQLQPGSRITFLGFPTRVQKNIIYFPQGTYTTEGSLPFTVVAIAVSWKPYDPASVHSTSEIDRHDYMSFIVYPDGEIEPDAYDSAYGIYSRYHVPFPGNQ